MNISATTASSKKESGFTSSHSNNTTLVFWVLCGIPCMCIQALRMEVAADGVVWSQETGQSSTFFVLKSKDAPPEMGSKQEYVYPVLIVPNEPKSVTVFMVMILMLFVVMTPMAGAHTLLVNTISAHNKLSKNVARL
jgi:hypothetical protein